MLLKSILSVIILLLGSLSILLAVLYVFQNRFIYPSPKLPVLETLPNFITRMDFTESYGYLALPQTGIEKAPLLIFTHGNGEIIDIWVDQLQPLLDAGIAVLLVEFPGYGNARGKTSMGSIHRTVLEAYDQAAALPEIDSTKIVAYGRSIGGGAACLLSQHRKLAAVALESTFSSLQQLILDLKYPSFLLRDRYENENIVKQLDIPVFVFHGTEDQLINFRHGEALAAAAKDSTFVTDTCGHSDCSRKWPELIEFLYTKLPN